MKAFLAAIALAAAAPAVAQDEPPAPAAFAPDHMAQAWRMVDHVWPLGTYERIMGGAMQGIFDEMFGMAMDMSVETAAGWSGEEVDPADAGKTVGEAVAKDDPHFKERMALVTGVLQTEMTALMTTFEPQVRQALANAYARRLTVAELQDLNTFFATPTGAKYAAMTIDITMDPEFVREMGAVTPAFMEALPAMMEKMEAATAHLPPPPKKDAGPDEPEADDESLLPDGGEAVQDEGEAEAGPAAT